MSKLGVQKPTWMKSDYFQPMYKITCDFATLTAPWKNDYFQAVHKIYLTLQLEPQHDFETQ